MKRRRGFVANSSTTAFIISVNELTASGAEIFEQFKTWAEDRLLPQLIDTDTQATQYCYLDDVRVLIYGRDDSIADEISDAEIQEVSKNDIKCLQGKPCEYTAGIFAVLEENGVEITESIERGILHEVLKIVIGDEYSS